MPTAAVPTQEYYVLTDTGRAFVWSAVDMTDLFRQLIERGHRAEKVQLYSEYEAYMDRVIEKGDEAA